MESKGWSSIEKIKHLEQQLVQPMVKEWLKTDKEADAWFDSNYSTQSQLRSAFLIAAVKELENQIRALDHTISLVSQQMESKGWSSIEKIKHLEQQLVQELENEIRLTFVGAVPKSQFPDAEDWSSTRKIKELKDQILDLEVRSAEMLELFRDVDSQE